MSVEDGILVACSGGRVWSLALGALVRCAWHGFEGTSWEELVGCVEAVLAADALGGANEMQDAREATRAALETLLAAGLVRQVSPEEGYVPSGSGNKFLAGLLGKERAHVEAVVARWAAARRKADTAEASKLKLVAVGGPQDSALAALQDSLDELGKLRASLKALAQEEKELLEQLAGAGHAAFKMTEAEQLEEQELARLEAAEALRLSAAGQLVPGVAPLLMPAYVERMLQEKASSSSRTPSSSQANQVLMSFPASSRTAEEVAEDAIKLRKARAQVAAARAQLEEEIVWNGEDEPVLAGPGLLGTKDKSVHRFTKKQDLVPAIKLSQVPLAVDVLESVAQTLPVDFSEIVVQFRVCAEEEKAQGAPVVSPTSSTSAAVAGGQRSRRASYNPAQSPVEPEPVAQASQQVDLPSWRAHDWRKDPAQSSEEPDTETEFSDETFLKRNSDALDEAKAMWEAHLEERKKQKEDERLRRQAAAQQGFRGRSPKMGRRASVSSTLSADVDPTAALPAISIPTVDTLKKDKKRPPRLEQVTDAQRTPSKRARTAATPSANPDTVASSPANRDGAPSLTPSPAVTPASASVPKARVSGPASKRHTIGTRSARSTAADTPKTRSSGQRSPTPTQGSLTPARQSGRNRKAAP